MENNSSVLGLKLNTPFDIAPLKKLFVDIEDFAFLRPSATFPLEENEWIEVFAKLGNTSILVYQHSDLIGHFGFVAETDVRYRLVYFYLAPEVRGKGFAPVTLKLAENYAIQELGAREICLNVQELNIKAIALYKKFGFHQSSHVRTTISMVKIVKTRD